MDGLTNESYVEVDRQNEFLFLFFLLQHIIVCMLQQSADTTMRHDDFFYLT
jgi:hypothetical protein